MDGPLFIALNVGHELINGDVKLLNFTSQESGRHQDVLGLVLKNAVAQKESLEIDQGRPLGVFRHRRLEFLSKIDQLLLVISQQHCRVMSCDLKTNTHQKLG